MVHAQATVADPFPGRIRIVRGPGAGIDPDQERAAVMAGLLGPLPSVNSKYFYDDRGSHLFEDITRLPEYYQTRTEEALLEAIADDVVSRVEPRRLVELGSGAGRKIRLLLDSMEKAGHLHGCILLDINETFIAESAERLAAAYPALKVCGIVGDFLHDLERIEPAPDRLFIFLAGTIGNLYPTQLSAFLRRVRRTLAPRDAFLVGLDLVKDIDRLEAAYNDSQGVTAEFNRNILRVLNRRFDTDFDLTAFDHVAFFDQERQWIEMRLRAVNPTRVSLGGGQVLRFDEGDEIRTEVSCKFTRESFEGHLRAAAMTTSRWYTDPEDLFALALVRPI